MHHFAPVDNTFQALCDREPPIFSNEVVALVDQIWADACEKQPSLFDGKALGVSEISEGKLHCYSLPYRFVFAQSRNDDVARQLNLTAAAVSGVVLAGDKLFVGRRAQSVTSERGKLELVPSGGLAVPQSGSHIDFVEQLLVELEEEIAVSRERVKTVYPFALIQDKDAHVVDICCKIILSDTNADQILQEFRPNEYSQLSAHTAAEAQQMAQSTDQDWVLASNLILSHLLSTSRQS